MARLPFYCTTLSLAWAFQQVYEGGVSILTVSPTAAARRRTWHRRRRAVGLAGQHFLRVGVQWRGPAAGEAVIFAHTPSSFSRHFNEDGEGVSAK